MGYPTKNPELQFYVLNPTPTGAHEGARTDAMREECGKLGPARTCPACGGIVGMRSWLPPYRAEIDTWGSEYGDLAFGGADWFLVSGRFADMYHQNSLRGLGGFDPIEITRVKCHSPVRGRLPNYFKVDVCQSSVIVDPVASGSEWAPTTKDAIDHKDRHWGIGEVECSICMRRKGTFVRQKTLVIQHETWTGEDVFSPLGSGPNFVTSSRFKSMCQAHDIKNAVFVPAEYFELDFFPSVSKQLLKHLRVFEDRNYDRESRQDAYRTMAFVVGRPMGFENDFDPNTEIDPTIVDEVRKRLTGEGVL
jgi:hypothetical protein